MSIVVSIQEVVAAMDVPSSEWQSYLNPETGEIVTVTDEDRRALESGDTDSDLPDWQQESLRKAREVEGSDRYLPLPDRFEIHEWSIMSRFCDTVEGPEARDELLGSIHGRGAFRHFHRTAGRLGIRDAWHRYRDSELERIARDWLEAHQVAYK